MCTHIIRADLFQVHLVGSKVAVKRAYWTCRLVYVVVYMYRSVHLLDLANSEVDGILLYSCSGAMRSSRIKCLVLSFHLRVSSEYEPSMYGPTR